jgi:membrane fusion protein (multidrug efflux system)
MAEPARTEATQAPESKASDDVAKVTELPRTHQRRRNLLRGVIRFALMVVVPVTLVLYGATIWATSLRYVSTENAYVKSNLVAVSADVSGRVTEINVRENQPVRRGDVLFRLDPRDFRLEAASIVADLQSVEREIQAMRNEYRAGEKELEELGERIAFLEREFNRADSLAKRGVGTTARLDEARTDLALARREVSTKEQRLRTILAELGGSVDSPVEEHPKYQKLVAALEMAQLNLDRTTIAAPADGIVSNVKLRLGEYVRSGTPVFSLIEQPEYWIEANLKETQLTFVKVGHEATLVADAYPDATYKARIQSISPATGAEFALLPPQNASGNWVKVVQRVPVRLMVLEDANQPRLRAGMTVTVTIDTERERSLGLIVAEWLDDSGAGSFVPAAVTAWLRSS